MNFGNFNPFKKKEQSSSAAEKAKDLARGAGKLSVATIAFAGVLEATNVNAANIDIDSATKNTIELSTQQPTPKSIENTMSWEDVQKIKYEVDSLKKINTSLDLALQKIEKDSTVLANTFQSYFQKLESRYGKEVSSTEDALLEIEKATKMSIEAHKGDFERLYMDAKKNGISDERFAQIITRALFIKDVLNNSNKITGDEMTILGSKVNEFTFQPTFTLTDEKNDRAGLTGTTGIMSSRIENTILKYIVNNKKEDVLVLLNKKTIDYHDTTDQHNSSQNNNEGQIAGLTLQQKTE